MLYLHLIWRQLAIVGLHIATIGRIVWSYAKSHKVVSAVAGVVVILGAVTLVYLFGGAPTTATLSDTRAVHLIRVGDVSEAAPLSLIGTVRATREANVAPDISGTVAAVYRNLGDYVGAGTIIAELKNDTQRASVAQARAALQKTQSAVAVGGITVESAETSYASAQDSARAAIQTAYATVDDVINRKADQTFSNPKSPQPNFNVSSSNSNLVNQVEAGRLAMQPILARHAASQLATMNADQLLAELATLAGEVREVQTFMQNLVSVLNSAVATYGVTDAAIAGFRAEASAGLASANSLASTVTATTELIKAKRAAVAAASTGQATGVSGVSADIAGAEANLALALAGLEKTLIRAPISGTINRLDLDAGSFVNASMPVIYITSAGGLEVVAYVSGNDIAEIAVGAKATVGSGIQGTVARVAAALDPTTKKAEIRVAVPPSAPLVAGQSATIAIERTVRRGTVGAAGSISIPLSAVKITPEGTLVFTLNDDSVLVANPVTLGTLRGDKVEVTAGLTTEFQIIEDARGLKEGQKVVVN